MRVLRLLAAGLALAAATATAAPLGSEIGYQGRLMREGAPAQGLFDLELCLFDASGGGAPLACLPFADVPVEDGLFAVAPDFGAGAFIGEARYLELRVRPGAETGAHAVLTPRQLLRATPEALRAAAASSAPWSGLTGVPPGFADGSDDIGSGTVSAVTAGFGLSGGTITGTGTIGVDPGVMQQRIAVPCPPGQVLRGANADGSGVCAPDANSGGTVTSIAAGTGLSGGTITSNGTIAVADGGIGAQQVNPAQVQLRISDTCTAGATISAIAANGDVTCTPPPQRWFSSPHGQTNAVGADLSIALRADGIILVPHYESTGAGAGRLQVHVCSGLYCGFGNSNIIDNTGNTGWETRIAMRGDNRAVIAYHDIANRSLKLAICANASCNGGTVLTTLVDNATDVIGYYIDLKLAAGDIPTLSYARFSSDFASGSVQYLRCSNADCSGAQTPVTLASARVRSFTSVLLSSAPPQIVYDREDAAPTLEVVYCNNAACAAPGSPTVVKTLAPGPAGQGGDVALDIFLRPTISYYDGASGDLRVLHCLNPGCIPVSALFDTLLLSEGDVGWRSDIAIAANNLPVVAFYNATRRQYGVVRCLSIYCNEADVPVYVVGSQWAATVGSENTLALTLDPAGHPVMAMTRLGAGTTRFSTVRCESADCR